MRKLHERERSEAILRGKADALRRQAEMFDTMAELAKTFEPGSELDRAMWMFAAKWSS